jgi:pre-rRNA-processing protein TSR3
MFLFPHTLILRHRKENLKKCSLRGLEQRSDILFFTYPKDTLPDLSQHILLTINAPPLTPKDEAYGLFLIDGTWKHAEKMFNQLTHPHLFQERSLPSVYQTAYPRRQDDCSDPMRGLASVEALYIAYRILGRDFNDLLNNYFWKENFLKKNERYLI